MSGRKVSTRVVAFLLALVMCFGLMPLGALTARAETADPQLTAALEEARTYIDGITVNNTANDPATVVGNFGTHFSWDNEKREGSKSYLFDWSYYNGVVFEGLEYLYEVTGEEVYKDYVVEYMSTMINATGNWAKCANNSGKEAAGYNATHGADCYKTASLLLDAYAMTGDDRYLYTAAELYADLDTAAQTYLLSNAGDNFRHTWASDPTPDLWLDGLYMILPFRAEYAKHIGDTEELNLIVSRLQWVSDNMYNAEKGLFYHAADSATSNSGTYWLRSIGWYAAALVDVMDSMEGQNLQALKTQLVKLVDGMRACQNSTNGMWTNDMAKSQSSSNPYETSGTALVCYAVMKAVNNGWLDDSYADMALLAFKGICSEKLNNNNLTSICFKGVPGGSNSTYYDNEGKGLGPFIMFYAEVLEYVGDNSQEPEVPETTVPQETEVPETTVPQEPEVPETTVPQESEPQVTEPVVADQTVTANGVSAKISGVSAALTGAALSDGDKALLDAKNYEAYVALDVTGTVAEGETAVVSIAIPAGWDTDRVVGIHIENGAVVEIPGTVSGGKFTFEVSHFSGAGIALLAEGDPTNTGTGYLVGSKVYTLDTNGVTAGKNYLIVNTNNDTGYALTNNNGTAGRTQVAITGTGNNKTITVADDANIAWQFSGTNSGTVGNNGWYVYPDNGSLTLADNAGNSTMTISNQNQGQYRIYRTATEGSWWNQTTYYYHLRYNNGWTGTRNSGWSITYYNVYLYELTSSSAGEEVTFTITPGSVTLAPKGTQTLTGTVTVAGETVDLGDCTITWASGNNSIATVNNGTVTAVADGTANITATLSAVNGKALVNPIELHITVKVQSAEITFSTVEDGIETSAEVTLQGGHSQTLTPYITVSVQGAQQPVESSNITWTSSNSGVVTVDEEGVITAVGGGNATITATLTEANGFDTNQKVTYSVTVTDPEVTFSTQEDQVVKEESEEIAGGATQTLSPFVTLDGQGEDLTNCQITWESSNSGIPVDSATGLVTASAGGTTDVTATLTHVNGYKLAEPQSVTYHVTVTDPTAVTITLPETVNMLPGSPVQVDAVIVVDGVEVPVENCVIEWSSDNDDIPVDNQGQATAETVNLDAETTATITAKLISVNGYTLGEPVITTTTAVNPVLTFSIDPEEMTIPMLTQGALVPSIKLGDQEYLGPVDITWTSDNTEVVPVDEYGVVTGQTEGENVTITATLNTFNGFNLSGVSDTAKVSVSMVDVSAVELSVYPSNVLLKPGEKAQLRATVTVNGFPVDITKCNVLWSSGAESHATVDQSGLVTGVTPGSTSVTATLKAIGGVELEQELYFPVGVMVADLELKSAELQEYTGTVYQGSEGTVRTRATILVTYTYTDANGKTSTYKQTEYVTVEMLRTAEGKVQNADTTGTFPNLDVYFKDIKLTDEGNKFTLHVIPMPNLNFPEYPDDGSIQLEKYINDYSQFQETGVAEIHLATSGLPAFVGVDVILVNDLSNSMARAVGSDSDTSATTYEQTKMHLLAESIVSFSDTFLEPDSSGNVKNSITLVTFGGYDAQHTKKVYSNYADTTQTLFVASRSKEEVTATVRNIRLMVDDAVSDTVGTAGTGFWLSFDGGKTWGENYGNTNYDYAFMETMNAINAIKKNYLDTHGVDYSMSGRSIYILFMTDGAPSNFNGYYYAYKTGDRADVNATWINSAGNPEASYQMGNNRANYSFPEWQDIIDEPLYWADQVMAVEDVADIFPIGFDLANGGFNKSGKYDFNEEICVNVVEGLLSDRKLEVDIIKDADELFRVYNRMSAAIKVAAQNAYFVDQMGDSFNLQMAQVVTKFEGTEEENPITLDPAPKITVTTRNIFTRLDVGNEKEVTENGNTTTVLVTEEMRGEAYGDPVTVETVTFNEDGTAAYSDQLSGNILVDGVICAKTFWYNSTTAPVRIDSNQDGVLNESDVELPSKTFYWNIGTISDKRFQLSYYVALEGAADGTAKKDVYETNSYAQLHYKNWLGNQVYQDVESPVLSWGDAAVYYGFYLVDKYGNPVTNRATGATGKFEDAVKVTPKIFYKTIPLNSNTSINSVTVSADSAPKGYTPYDSGAKYQIIVDSAKVHSGWKITNTQTRPTTYVTDYRGNEYTNLVFSGSMNQDGIDYTSTTVWFAVVWEPATVDDVVVIDYGLPVEIDVTQNDMFGSAGLLNGLGKVDDKPNGIVSNNSFANSESTNFSATYNGDYGAASITTTDNKVRYVLNGMEMPTSEKICYEVRYEDPNTGSMQYYYGTLTIIPATTVYFEDSFVTYGMEEWDNTIQDWVMLDPETGREKWTITPNLDRVQAEDRPGNYSLPQIDANNVYGYDGAYTDVAEFSMGGAAKVTVNANYTAVASFDFYGTGFDVISLTNSTTGTIFADVYEYTGESTRQMINSFVVDTYYGYRQALCKVTYGRNSASDPWVPTEIVEVSVAGVSDKKPTDDNAKSYTVYENRWIPDNSESDTIFQVPVMKIAGLPYKRYHVDIIVIYDQFFDHGQNGGSGSYDFYLDAIRIYDPAGNQYKDEMDQEIQDAYVADNEGWPMYFELRNYMLSANSFSEDAVKLLGSNHAMTGAVFIDGDEAVGDAEMVDYKNFGPNNELYLAPGQDVAFILNLDRFLTQQWPEGGMGESTLKEAESIVASVQIGIKSATGETVNYTICNINENGEYYAAEASTLSTSTDMYYDITNYSDDLIVISNTHDTGDGKILSITNIKFTFTKNPTEFLNSSRTIGQQTQKVQTLSTGSTPQTLANGAENKEDVGMIYMTYEATQRTLQVLNTRSLPGEDETPEETIPETTVPEATEPETTEPETTVPETTEPEVTEPETTVPETTQPEATKPEQNKPGHNKPEQNKPEQNKPEQNKPEQNKPEQNKPEQNKPGHNKPEQNKPEPTVPAPVEPVVFEPWFLDLFISDSSVKEGDKVIITVVTSADVESLTVNGREVKQYIESGWWIKTRTWIVAMKASRAGELVIDVVAYDNDSVASNTERETVEVREKKPGLGSKPSGKKQK